MSLAAVVALKLRAAAAAQAEEQRSLEAQLIPAALPNSTVGFEGPVPTAKSVSEANASDAGNEAPGGHVEDGSTWTKYLVENSMLTLSHRFKDSETEERYREWHTQRHLSIVRIATMWGIPFHCLLNLALMFKSPAEDRILILVSQSIPLAITLILIVMLLWLKDKLKWHRWQQIILALVLMSYGAAGLFLAVIVGPARAGGMRMYYASTCCIGVLSSNVFHLSARLVLLVLVSLWAPLWIWGPLYPFTVTLHEFFSQALLMVFLVIVVTSAWGSDRRHRAEYTNVHTMQSRLRTASRKNQELHRQLVSLQQMELAGRQAVDGVDFDSPLDKAIGMLDDLRTNLAARFGALAGARAARGDGDSGEEDEDATLLGMSEVDAAYVSVIDQVITMLLGSSQMHVPDLAQQVRDGTLQLDREMSRWLFSEIAPGQLISDHGEGFENYEEEPQGSGGVEGDENRGRARPGIRRLSVSDAFGRTPSPQSGSHSPSAGDRHLLSAPATPHGSDGGSRVTLSMPALNAAAAAAASLQHTNSAGAAIAGGARPPNLGTITRHQRGSFSQGNPMPGARQMHRPPSQGHLPTAAELAALHAAAAAAAAAPAPRALPTYDEAALAKHLEKLGEWEAFDIFEVAERANGCILAAVQLSLFRRHGLLHEFHLDEKKLLSWFLTIGSGYRESNPYHNQIHAADVSQSFEVILQRGLAKHLTKLDLLAAFIGVAIHDYEHPGLNNNFQVTTGSPLAILYNDRSPLESHHVAAAWRSIREPQHDFLRSLPKSQYRELRRLVIDMVLSTDMTQHFEVLGHFKQRAAVKFRSDADAAKEAAKEEASGKRGGRDLKTAAKSVLASVRMRRALGGTFSLKQEAASIARSASSGHIPGSVADRAAQALAEINRASSAGEAGHEPECLLPPAEELDADSRRLLVSTAMKCVDIGHVAKPIELHKEWTRRVQDEFFAQGDRERQLGLPISPFMDRQTTQLESSQIGFCDFIVFPLFNAWASVFPSAGELLLRGVQRNYAYWKERKAEADAKAAAAGGTGTSPDKGPAGALASPRARSSSLGAGGSPRGPAAAAAAAATTTTPSPRAAATTSSA
eukprot:tig00001187_g7471.t1